ncbi:hypothetical protein HPB50_025349 [Hyalomma asiaticum]|uniref:Uncharacterized protein n=1 Tax=Hyalomma asiaticum TaxID=266040 RepID=A0ACB7RZZ8_HYAAI|nr:hypothetical protein HPB50_025349 [Hyalomma asiaticum]
MRIRGALEDKVAGFSHLAPRFETDKSSGKQNSDIRGAWDYHISTITFGIVAVIMIMVIVAVVSFLLVGEVSDDSEDLGLDSVVEGKPGGSSGDGGEIPLPPELPIAPVLVTLPTPGPIRRITPRPFTSPPRPPATLPPPPPSEKSDAELVCTVGSLATDPNFLPTDGLCDYLFYCNVLFLKGKLMGVELNGSWTVFVDSIGRYSSTEGGIGFDVRYLSQQTLENTALQRLLDTLASSNLKHYGLFNILTQANRLLGLMDKVIQLIDGLKSIQGNDSKRKTMIAIGVFNYADADAWSLYSNQFRRAVGRTKADTVIALSSTSSIESGKECHSAPPSVYDATQLPEPARSRARAYPDFDCVGLGSVTLLPGGVEVGLPFSRPKSVELFEDEYSLEDKVSALSRDFKLRSNMAWLIMNVNLGDFTGTCYEEPFQLLEWLHEHLKAL